MFNFGQTRKFRHDIRVASILSTAAGAVNSASFFAFDVLTTNVTGHVAVLANEIVAFRWSASYMKMLWMLAFLLGSFLSGVLVDLVGRKHPRFSHTTPLMIVILILGSVAYFGDTYYDYSDGMIQIFAGSLLFGMGMQNATITQISGAAIRTTHLTGLFTDIGIEIAKVITRPPNEDMPKLMQKLTLHLVIVFFFLAGAIGGGFLFSKYLFKAFIAPLTLIFIAVVYDILDYRTSKLQKALLQEDNKIASPKVRTTVSFSSFLTLLGLKTR
jgi:uncharacterized membrane protein YoaK (UPF0700 family)